MGREGRGENRRRLLQQELLALECSYERKDLQESVLFVSTPCSIPGDGMLEQAVPSARRGSAWTMAGTRSGVGWVLLACPA